MNRRRFLQLTGASTAAFVAGRYYRGRSHAAVFGEQPAGAGSVMLPKSRQTESVLEIFLYGGLSPWETLYLAEDHGRPDDPDYPNQQFYTFLGTEESSVEAALGACEFPEGEPMSQYFADDADGVPIGLGPFAHRLRQRDDLVDRMRIVVQKHLLEPHEAAVPQALTGRPVGQPSAAGLGSHVQRYFAERADDSRTAPHSYVFAVGGIAGDNVSAAAATGYHPGLARPLQINITNAEGFAELLGRGEVGEARATYDQLMSVYTEQYRKRLQWKGDGPPVRSSSFTDLVNAKASVEAADAIRDVMEPSLFDALPGTSCGVDRDIDVPGMSLQAARHLLTHPSQPARYVCVSDIGLYEASGGGGYDCHTSNSADTARNFDNLLRNLGAIINEPGESDPTKLDLDRTLIILNTEFGRTAFAQGSSGRNHHPYGYVTAFLGGPIREPERGIFGAIGPDSVAPTNRSARPAENRIAALLALGIWPFASEGFAVSDVRGAESEEDAAAKVIENFFGVKP